MTRGRPPRPALVRALVRAGDRSGVALAATVALAIALVVATSLALAGHDPQPDATRTDPPTSTSRPGDEPADFGLTATPTTLVWTTPVSSASSLASDHRLDGAVRRAAGIRPAPATTRHDLGSRGAVRTRAQRWFARRNLEGG